MDNFLTVRNAFVYYWPITQEWKTDTSVLNVPFTGTLQLTGPGLKEPRLIPPVRYTYYNTRGEYELNWKVATGRRPTRPGRNTSSSWRTTTAACRSTSRRGRPTTPCSMN